MNVSRIPFHGDQKTYSTATGVSEDLLEVDSAVEVERAVLVDVNPVTLVVSGGVEHRDLIYVSLFLSF